jgi:hypothetical protein
MAKQNKYLCRWKKDKRIKELERYSAMVKKPKAMCKNCGRVAAKKKWLCEPISLDQRG